MCDFNIKFNFLDNMADAITRAENQWNGTTVCVSRNKFDGLSPRQQQAVLLHECLHAIYRRIYG